MEGFKKAYEDLEEEYALVKEMLTAQARLGLSQEAVAELMGTTKSAISRLEAAGKHSPSMTTLKKYAHAVGVLPNRSKQKPPRHLLIPFIEGMREVRGGLFYSG